MRVGVRRHLMIVPVERLADGGAGVGLGKPLHDPAAAIFAADVAEGGVAHDDVDRPAVRTAQYGHHGASGWRLRLRSMIASWRRRPTSKLIAVRIVSTIAFAVRKPACAITICVASQSSEKPSTPMIMNSMMIPRR